MKFSPAPGQTVVTTPNAAFYQGYVTIRAEIQNDVIFAAEDLQTKESYSFGSAVRPAVGNWGGASLTTLHASIPITSSSRKLEYTTIQDGKKEYHGSISIHPQAPESQASCPFKTEVGLSEMEVESSNWLPWLDLDEWEGWLWIRPTWVEPQFMRLSQLPSNYQTQALLLRKIDCNSTVLFIVPVSSDGVLLHISAARQGEQPGAYIRARRANGGTGKASGQVISYLSTTGDTSLAIKEVMGAAVKKVDMTENDNSPFDALGFCTWSSLGEFVLPTKQNMRDLVASIADDKLPIGTFIIDDGWQDVRHNGSDGPDNQGLWGFGAYEGLGGSLEETVCHIKEKLPTVKDVGVWMSIQGYWNGTVPSSPLVPKYDMSPYRISAARVPKIQNGSSAAVAQIVAQRYSPNREWYLPHPSRAFDFWKDYFRTCATAGITFVKVDNQASISLLEGQHGAEAAHAMWNGMFAAANEVFGPEKVIHCMSHSERMFVGDIATGLATQGQRIMFRNTNDFGLPTYTHAQHILYNVYNSLVLSNTCLILDADMFMTGKQWPEYHAVLRAFFPGPIILSDHPGKHNLEVIHRLIGVSKSGAMQTIRAQHPLRPLANRLWETGTNAECETRPAIKASTCFPLLNSAVIVAWSHGSVKDCSLDVISEIDIRQALELTPKSGGEYVVWFANARQCVPVSLSCNINDGNKSKARFESSLVATLVLQPEAHEVLRIVPNHTLSKNGPKVAFLGLLDKYAGLAAAEHVIYGEGRLVVEILYEGVVAFVVSSAELNVNVDGREFEARRTELSEACWLVEVELKRGGNDADAGGSWKVEILA
ncbi:hypothetical protein V502_02203 [Pseudogymnoascus sp. VKM F-4520 (FW-2644)]|nr:hypothetical protein V502_02203 [Pseudogymnoascus sp. VKM F-4520 (FW-2644)]